MKTNGAKGTGGSDQQGETESSHLLHICSQEQRRGTHTRQLDLLVCPEGGDLNWSSVILTSDSSICYDQSLRFRFKKPRLTERVCVFCLQTKNH